MVWLGCIDIFHFCTVSATTMWQLTQITATAITPQSQIMLVTIHNNNVQNLVQEKDTCCEVEFIIIIINRFCIALLSALEHSLHSHVILHEWIVFIARFWISTEVVYLQRWRHKNLLPERVSLGAFCVHHTTMHRATSCKATYVRCMRV